MATFIHLAPERSVKSILRNGIKPSRTRYGVGSGVFAMPVVPNYFASHQWLRELKRGGQRTICGIYFRLPDKEPVWVGHYNRPHLQVTADAAIASILDAGNSEGFQVVIPRPIVRAEIRKAVAVSQLVGWRYYPEAHGRPPCGCPACLRRGEIKSRRLREAYERGC